MNDRQRNDQLDELGRRYRSIEAPAYLATRILASVEERVRPRWRWRTAVLAGAAAAALIVATPLVRREGPGPAPGPGYPSLTGLAGSMPPKPAAPMPGLASMGSVSIPSMPTVQMRTPARVEPPG